MTGKSEIENQAQRRHLICPVCGQRVGMMDDYCPHCQTVFNDFHSQVVSEKPSKSKGRQKKEKLIAMDDLRSRYQIKNQLYTGVKSVPINKIIGSFDRYRDFNQAFLPTEGFTTKFLQPLVNKMEEGFEVAPISVYELEGHYFVVDGHHRIAAHYYLNREFIDADVTRLELDLTLNSSANADYDSVQLRKFIVELERRSFSQKTYLYNEILVYPIEVSNMSAYKQLYDEILEQHEQSERDLKSANFIATALEWYRNQFLPVIKILKRYPVLAKNKKRSLSDFYVWLRIHRVFLKNISQTEVSLNESIRDFIEIAGKKKFNDDLPVEYDEYLRYIFRNV